MNPLYSDAFRMVFWYIPIFGFYPYKFLGWMQSLMYQIAPDTLYKPGQQVLEIIDPHTFAVIPVIQRGLNWESDEDGQYPSFGKIYFALDDTEIPDDWYDEHEEYFHEMAGEFLADCVDDFWEHPWPC